MKKAELARIEAIIAKMQELVDYYPKVRSFYEGKKPLAHQPTLSQKIRLDYEKQEAFFEAVEANDYATADALYNAGFTDNCLVGCLRPLKDDADIFKRIDDDMFNRFSATCVAFVAMLRKALAKDRKALEYAHELLCYNSVPESREVAVRQYHNLLGKVIAAGISLSLIEMKIYCAHPKWKVNDDSVDRAELHESYVRISRFMREFPCICHLLPQLTQNFKRNEWLDLPRAFIVPSRNGSRVISYQWSVRQCLSATAVFDWGSFDAGLGDCSQWLGDHIRDCIVSLHDYFVRRAAKSSKDSRLLWIEADAELVAFIYGGDIALALDADKIIDLANAAARSEWSARRLARGYDDVKIEFLRPNERQMQCVHLDEMQLAALVAARANGRRDTNKIIGEVRKAAAGSDSGCHHRDKAKDKVVQVVIRHLAKPGVVFSIHDACEKVGGRRNASWLYSWCHDHEDEIHAQVDILHNIEGAFRS